VFPNWGKVIAVVALVAAFMTSFYMFRVVFLTFFGKARYDTAHVHPHEAGWTMTVPLIALAIPSLALGALVGIPPDAGRFHRFIEPVFSTEHVAESTAHTGEQASLYTLPSVTDTQYEGEEATAEAAAAHHEISNTTKWAFGIISTVVALSGILLAYLMYITQVISPVAMGARFSNLYAFLYNRWGIDDLYDRRVVQPFKRFSMVLWRVVDMGIIDGTVNGLAGVVSGSSARLRKVQTGLVSNYALAIALGMVVIIGIYFAAFSDLIR
ncbi:MAG TPA: hypothetical protein PK819_13600, partial [Thermomicrobiales bacterium]|nr:hypothetical protein [Thermomicrobiales bacterium]